MKKGEDKDDVSWVIRCGYTLLTDDGALYPYEVMVGSILKIEGASSAKEWVWKRTWTSRSTDGWVGGVRREEGKNSEGMAMAIHGWDGDFIGKMPWRITIKL